jgi:DNA adenine methylase
MKSLFRYPGAKTRLIKKFDRLLDAMIQGKEAFVEPFVGGGSVGLYVAEKYPLLPLYFNDLDPWISAFWSVMGDGTHLEHQRLLTLVNRQPTIKMFHELRDRGPRDVIEEAFYAVFFNRTTFSGILDAGPIGGLQQNSKWKVDCRYNADLLMSSIDAIYQLLHGRVTVTRGNGIQRIEFGCHSGMLLYVDPPYYEKGNDLYPISMTHEDHLDLVRSMRTTTASWILSYDSCAFVKEMYTGYPALEINARYSVSGQNRENWVAKREFLCWNDLTPGLAQLVQSD